MISGTIGEIGQLDNILGSMKASMEDKEVQRAVGVKEKSGQEKAKNTAGKELVLQALRGRSGLNQSNDNTGNDKYRKRRKVDYMDGMQTIGEAAKAYDEKRFDVESENIELERERLKVDAAEKKLQESREKLRVSKSSRKCVQNVKSWKDFQKTATVRVVR